MKSPTGPLLFLLCFVLAAALQAASTINTVERFAYSANTGWVNWRWDTGVPGEGAIVTPYALSGFIYGANIGWINLGDGDPDNGIHYSQLGGDFGVNHDGLGNLTGYAYGANVGWINFEQDFGIPKIDLATGAMSGFAYGANIGWIDLGTDSNVLVQTDTIDPGPDSDTDSIPDAWEREQVLAAGLDQDPVADLTLLSGGTADADGDGQSDVTENAGDTDPFDPLDLFAIIEEAADLAAGDVALEWVSSPRRVYAIAASSPGLSGFAPVVLNVMPDPGATTVHTFNAAPLGSASFWRVHAKSPLAP